MILGLKRLKSIILFTKSLNCSKNVPGPEPPGQACQCLCPHSFFSLSYQEFRRKTSKLVEHLSPPAVGHTVGERRRTYQCFGEN